MSDQNTPGGLPKLRLRWELSVGDIAMFAGLLIAGSLAWARLEGQVETKADDIRVTRIETRQEQLIQRVDRNEQRTDDQFDRIEGYLRDINAKLDRKADR